MNRESVLINLAFSVCLIIALMNKKRRRLMIKPQKKLT